MSDAAPTANRIESLVLTLIFAAISLALLASLWVATRHGPVTQGWWTRPALMPGLALSALVLANVLSVWGDFADLRRNPLTAPERAEAVDKFAGWLRPLEYLGYFALYLWALQHLGYFPSSVLFVQGLMFRAGLRGWRWVLTGLLAVLALTAIFRMGLGVWMPAPDYYDRFPEGIRSALIRWF